MTMTDNAFWAYLETLIASSVIEVDRQRGSEHPVYPGAIYPIDYGFLAGTVSADGGGIDIWIGSTGENRVTGIISTVDLTNKDAEVKILYNCTPEEMHAALAFNSQGDQRGILTQRED